MTRVGRRALLAAACTVSTALAACADPLRLVPSLGALRPLRVRILGFPADVAASLGEVLKRCAQGYADSGRGLVNLDLTHTPVPDIDADAFAAALAATEGPPRGPDCPRRGLEPVTPPLPPRRW